MPAPIDAIAAFLAEAGIPASEGRVRDDSFLPGVEIRGGRIVFDRTRLRWPGDLLHEAGHIATTPAALRPSLDDGLEGTETATRLAEVEAIAWSWAAVVRLGLDPAVLFHPEGYRGQSASLLFTYTHGVYPGAPGLARAGMTLVGEAARVAGVPPYPHMTQWLRD